VLLNGECIAKHHLNSRVSRKLFKDAGVKSQGNMLSHRLRDTFAVDLLEKGVPLEEVSKLLGHESIKTTERHYSKWVKGRRDRLDNLVTATCEEIRGCAWCLRLGGSVDALTCRDSKNQG
jgi:site-specific recombinase XerD